MSLDAFEHRLKKERGHECFELEDDLMACRFAHEGMEYWAPRVEELRAEVDHGLKVP